jgi:hypothetical protein
MRGVPARGGSGTRSSKRAIPGARLGGRPACEERGHATSSARKSAQGPCGGWIERPYYLWATQPERIREVGCIYSAQGFEFDYCGVILGDDLVWREGVGWVANKDASEDSAIFRHHDPGEFRQLLQHSYRVLLTRGMKGTFVYSTDPSTRRMLHELTRRSP